MAVAVPAEEQTEVEEQEETLSALVDLRRDADLAEGVVLELLDEDRDKLWTMSELQDAVTEASSVKRTPISIAINHLWQENKIEFDTYLKIQRVSG